MITPTVLPIATGQAERLAAGLSVSFEARREVYAMPYVNDLEQAFPDPQKTPHDWPATEELRAALPFVKDYLWVDEDGRMFLERRSPLPDADRKAIEAAGYEVGLQPTIFGWRVQYKLVKR